MSINVWLSRPVRLASRTQRPAPRPPFTGKARRTPRGARPCLENLEGRLAPSTLTVSNIDDSGVAGDGSLRGEILAASIGDTIVFDPSLSGSTINLAKGELLINKNLSILGLGAAKLTISGQNASRVFEVAAGASAMLSDLTVSGGDGVPNNSPALHPDRGGGIVVDENSSLTITRCTVSDNFVIADPHLGGGLGGGIADYGTLSVSDSTVSGNHAKTTYGGGIAVFFGTLTVSDQSVVSNNEAAQNGGGITGVASTMTVRDTVLSNNFTDQFDGGAFNVQGGTLALTGSTLSDNRAAEYGGGIYSTATVSGGILYPGTVTIGTSTLSGNSAADGGGIFHTGVAINGIFHPGTMTVSASTLSDNSAAYGGGIYNNGTLTVLATTVCRNSATLAGVGEGGGIDNESFSMALISGSTLSGNSAAQNGGGIFNSSHGPLTVSDSTISGNSVKFSGGGIWNGGTMTVSDATLANNSADYGGGGIWTVGPLSVSGSTISGNSTGLEGGGIHTGGPDGTLYFTVALANNIIAGNSTSFGGPDIWGAVGTGASTDQPVVSNFNNLIGSSIGVVSGLTNGVNGNRLDLSADEVGLAPLSDNGGPTQTMALLPGSLALGAGVASAQLASSLAPSETTLGLLDTNYLALVPGYTVLLIDSEQLLVTAVSGGSITVTRGYNRTAALAHANGAGVYSAFDQRGVLRAIPPCIGAYEGPSLTIDQNSLDLATTTYGTAGMIATYHIGGNALSGSALITAPAGVELSTDGVNWSAFLTLIPGASTLAITTIDVRISAGSNAGNLSGLIKDTSSGAHELDVSLKGLITPAMLTVTPVAGQFKIYGAPVQILGYVASGFVNDDTATTLTGSLGTTATLGSPVGDYVFTIDGLDAGPNYTIALEENAPTYAVAPAKLFVTADPQTKLYGDADPNLTYVAAGFQLNDTAATVLTGHLLRGIGETVPGGPYTINQGNLTANSNYTIAFVGNFLTITPATLTVTVDPQTKIYGKPDPALTYIVLGLQFGDKPGSVLTGSLGRDLGETALGGPYAILPGTLQANSNYVMAFTGSILTITPAKPTVEVIDVDGTYNGLPFTAQASVAGVDQIAGSSLEKVTPSLVYYSGSTAGGSSLSSIPLLPGTYTVVAAFGGSPDYTSASASTTFSIKDPTSSIAGATSGVPGQPLTYTFAVNGPRQGLVFSINYGDGSSVKTSAGGPSIELDHLYTAPGSFTIQVAVTDKNGVVSQPAVRQVKISTVVMEADSSGGTALAVGGNASGGDSIIVSATDTTGQTVNVSLNGASLGTFTPTGHIFVYGQGGKDKITLKSYVAGKTEYYIRVPAFVYGGGSGGDKISALGSAANNVLTGNGTNEVLTGGQGRDLLIGGTGAATLNAGTQDDVLIGGRTDYDIASAGTPYDQKLTALYAIMAEWGSAQSYGARLNGLAGYLNSKTVHDDYINGVAVTDTILGNSAVSDWFFVGINDSVKGTNKNDVITTIK
jgi:predicted outer membrane repeat protein